MGGGGGGAGVPKNCNTVHVWKKVAVAKNCSVLCVPLY